MCDKCEHKHSPLTCERQEECLVAEQMLRTAKILLLALVALTVFTTALALRLVV